MRPVRPVLASLLAALVVAGCSSSEDAANTPEETTSTAASSADTTSGAATESDATPSETTADSTGAGISGDGYSLAIPDGWEDVTDLAKQTNDQADIAIAEPTKAGAFRTNFNVVTPNPIADTVTDEQLAAQAATELKSVTHGKVLPVQATFAFDGVEPLGQKSEVPAEGFDVTVLQFIIVHEGKVYPTTLTYETKRESEAAALMDEIAGSWTWE